jgi:DNA-binding Lrp family transcriptional regulator
MIHTKKQLDILHTIAHCGHLPLAVISQLTPYSTKTLRGYLNGLMADGLVKSSGLIDFSRLGYKSHNLVFEISEMTSKINSLLAWLQDHSQVAWLAKLDDGLRYELTFMSSDPDELDAFVSMLKEQLPVSTAIAVSTETAISVFGRKYAQHKTHLLPYPSFVAAPKPKSRGMDIVDHSIIESVVHGEFLTHRQLSDELEISQACLKRRLQRLSAKGILFAQTFQINTNLYECAAEHILIWGNGLSSSFDKRFEWFCRLHPNVNWLIRSNGEWDFKLLCEGDSHKQIRKLLLDLQKEFKGELARIERICCTEALKCNPYPLLPDEFLAADMPFCGF